MEIYPGSTCSLSDSGIHHCREGILIKVSLPGAFPRAPVFPGERRGTVRGFRGCTHLAVQGSEEASRVDLRGRGPSLARLPRAGRPLPASGLEQPGTVVLGRRH